jgi:hypothetical protein
MGFLIRGKQSVEGNRETLHDLLGDNSEVVRIAAAEALGRYGTDRDAKEALEVLLGYADPAENGVYVAMMAMNGIDYMDKRAGSARARIESLPDFDPAADQRLQNYIVRLKEKTLADLD